MAEWLEYSVEAVHTAERQGRTPSRPFVAHLANLLELPPAQRRRFLIWARATLPSAQFALLRPVLNELTGIDYIPAAATAVPTVGATPFSRSRVSTTAPALVRNWSVNRVIANGPLRVSKSGWDDGAPRRLRIPHSAFARRKSRPGRQGNEAFVCDWTAETVRAFGDARMVSDERFGSVLALAHQSRAFLSIRDDARFSLGPAGAVVSIWVNASSGGREQTLVEHYVEAYGLSKRYGWSLSWRADGSLIVGGGTSTDGVLAATPPLSLAGAWHNVVLTRSRADLVQIFVDGTELARAEISPELPLATPPAAQVPLLVGRRAGEQGFFFDGRVGPLFIANGRGLAPDDVEHLWCSSALSAK